MSLAIATALLSQTRAHADDQPFLTIYTTDIDAQGEREVEQWLKWKAGDANESFNEFESRSEFEYGITDNLQGSLYLNYTWDRTRPHAPLAPADTEGSLSLSGELIYRVLNVYFDPIGLAFYVEPRYGERERSFETKILLQKNFFNDTLRNAININFEDRWEKRPLGGFNKASAFEIDAGSSYNITPELSLGLEFDNERGFDGLILGGSATNVSNSFYLGPTVQYIASPVVITLGGQAQLPWASNPGHVPGNVVGGLTAGDEHFRMTLRVSADLY